MPDSLLAELDRVQAARRGPSPPPGGDPLLGLLDDVQGKSSADALEHGPSLTERAIPTALRVGGSIVGGVMGSLGGPVGTLAGGAVGSGLGELAAEEYERRTGQRGALNPTQVVVQTGLGAIPMGRALGSTVPGIIASRGIQGAVMGGGSTLATQLAETGELPSGSQLLTGTGLGALLGGTMGAVEGRAVARTPGIVESPRRPVAALPPGPRFHVSPEGNVAPVGVELPARQIPDASGGRTIPASVVDFDATGAPIYSSDPSATSVARPVRGLLPAGPRFVASAEGVARAEDAAILSALDEVQSRPAPDASGGGSVRAAVLERELDPTRPAKQAVTVRQYASDPNAVDAPLLNEAELRMLRVMREDLDTFRPERGRLVRDPNDSNGIL